MPLPRYSRCSFSVFLVSLLFVGVTSSWGQTSPARPAYGFLRWTENWSVMARGVAGPADPFDPIKYLDLSGDGSAWASFGGDVRVRAETWENFNFGAPVGVSHDDTFVLSRFRTHADLQTGGLRWFGEIKGAYASDRNLPGGVRSIDEDKFELQQFFAEITVPGDAPLKVRAGRQLLAFGAQRLVSGLPWANALRTWDAVRVDGRVADWDVTAFGAAFVPVKPDGIGEADTDQMLYGVHARRVVPGTAGGVELYALANAWPTRTFNGTTGPDDRRTLGVRKWGAIADRGDYEMEFSYQTGSVGTGDVSAWSLATQLGWQVLADKSLRVWLGYDQASGDEAPGGKVGTFNQLYPLGHAYFGITDVIGRQNIIDLSAGAAWKAADDLTLAFQFHSFRAESTADAIYNPGGGVVRPGGSYHSPAIGSEFDVTARWAVQRHLVLEAGFGHFAAGEAIRETGSAQDIQFLYTSATFTF